MLKLSLIPLFYIVLTGSVNAQFFVDNFNNNSGTTFSLNDDLSIRQSGDFVRSHGTVSWIQGVAGRASRAEFLLRSQRLETNLQAGASAGRLFAHLDSDFAQALAGRNYELSFRLSMGLAVAGGAPFEEMRASHTQYRLVIAGSPAEAINHSSDSWDVALTISPHYQIRTGWVLRFRAVTQGIHIDLGDINFTPAKEGSGWRTPTETVRIAVNESKGTMTIDYGAATIASEINISSALGSNRYFAVQVFVHDVTNVNNTTLLQHALDDFTINLISR
jgi:hypothetical protein